MEERHPGTAPVEDGAVVGGAKPRPGFVSRYRLPLTLAAIALCGYVGSIVYIIYFRGQL